jgi:hypothetical protein
MSLNRPSHLGVARLEVEITPVNKRLPEFLQAGETAIDPAKQNPSTRPEGRIKAAGDQTFDRLLLRSNR